MAKTKSKPKTEECTHEWYIDTPDGPISMGRCRKCGLKSEFLNSDRMLRYDKFGKDRLTRTD